MDPCFGRAAFFISQNVGLFIFWLFFFARLNVFVRLQCQPSLFLRLTFGQAHDNNNSNARQHTGRRPLHYTRNCLVSMNKKHTRITSELVCILKDLCIGRNLPRKRKSRGGKRKQRRIPVLISKQRPNSDFHVGVDSHQRSYNILNVLPIKTSPNYTERNLCIASFNAQSLGPCDKRTAVCEFIMDRRIDIMFIQETWFQQTGDEGKCADIAPPGYSVRSFPRATRGGGLAAVNRSTLSQELSFVTEFEFAHTSFELVQITLSVPHRIIHFMCIYRVFPSKKNKLTDAKFLEEFQELLDHANTLPGTYMIVGDMNIHYDQPQNPMTAKMVELLDSFNIDQMIDKPTHNRGHIIDWVLHRPDDCLVKSAIVTEELSSDHFCVICELGVIAPPPPTKFRDLRNLRAMNRDAFRQDLSVAVSPDLCPTLDKLNSTLLSVLDLHPPVPRHNVKSTRSAPWYSTIREELRRDKKARRIAEKT